MDEGELVAVESSNSQRNIITNKPRSFHKNQLEGKKWKERNKARSQHLLKNRKKKQLFRQKIKLLFKDIYSMESTRIYCL